MRYIKNYKSILVTLLLIVIVIGNSGCTEKGKDNQTHRLQWWLNAIHWDTKSRINNLSGKGVTIAVVDTSIDTSHPDLDGKEIEKYVVIEENSEEQRFEHGTAVAGIICASPHDQDGLLGIAENAKILSVVIGHDTETNLDALIKGIEYATSQNVDIINISAGIMDNDPKLKSAIDNAYDAGIIIVAASGNDLYGKQLYPAYYDNVISVDSVDSNRKKLYGENSGSVFLPGGNIVTTYSSIYEPKKYVSYSGTSMSTAMMSGIIALILEQNPNLSNRDVIAYFHGYSIIEFNTVKVLEDFKSIYT